MRNKKIQILLVFVLAIGLFGLLFYWRYGEKKQMESLNGLQETYKEYDKKIREIRNDMENKKAEVNDIEKPANVILAFSEEDQELMDRIVPALEGRGIQATLVLKNTAEHHQETVTYLGQQGWDFAFGGEIGEEKDAYIEMLKSTVKQYEESTGKIAGAYFFNGSFNMISYISPACCQCSFISNQPRSRKQNRCFQPRTRCLHHLIRRKDQLFYKLVL